MKRTAIITLAILMAFVLAAPVGAKEHKAGHAQGIRSHHPSARLVGLWNDPRVVEKLELTDTQVQALKDTDYSFREKMIEAKADFEKEQLNLEKIMSQQSLDENAAKKTAGRLSDLHGKMFLMHFDHDLTVRKLLSETQVEKLKKMAPASAEKRAKKMRHMRRTFEPSETEEESSKP